LENSLVPRANRGVRVNKGLLKGKGKEGGRRGELGRVEKKWDIFW